MEPGLLVRVPQSSGKMPEIELHTEMGIERRKAARKRLDQLAYIRIGSDNGGLISDLGEGGLGFQTIAAIEREGPLTFWFSLDPADRIQATGELAWTDESRKVGGLKFTKISQESLTQIRTWMGTTDTPAEAPPPPRQAPRDPLRFSPPPRKTKPASVPVTSSPIAQESVAVAAPPLPAPMPPPLPRPEPLRVMATTHAWSSPLSAPPKAVVSPEMIRGATTGLTILALVLTVTGLLFGYHRELGKGLVALGEKLTGESPLAEAAQAPGTNDTIPSQVQQPVGASSDPVADAKPSAAAPQTGDGSSISTPPAPARQPVPAQQMATAPPPRATPRSSIYTPPDSTAGFENLSAPNAQPADNGQLELDTALQFLNPSVGAPKTAEGARWLWMSVEKGNPKAEVMLADLFLRGDGVTKNCNQARVLLFAARKHGDIAAMAKLRTMSQFGCR